MTPKHLTVTAIGVGPSVPTADRASLDVCSALAQWAEAAGVVAHHGEHECKGAVAVLKSCLLNRLIYGGEAGPSRTPCPVHQGKWSGIHSGWPGSVWRTNDADVAMEVEPRLQEWWDAGCRCATHRGANDTTGWNPDKYCCAPADD